MKRPSTGVLRLVLLLSLVLTSSALLRSQSADTVLLNGKIFTRRFAVLGAPGFGHTRRQDRSPWAPCAEIKKLPGPKSQVVDLQGRTVIPG